MTPAEKQKQATDDTAQAIRLMAVKPAIFLLVPAVAAVIAVYSTLN